MEVCEVGLNVFRELRARVGRSISIRSEIAFN